MKMFFFIWLSVSTGQMVQFAIDHWKPMTSCSNQASFWHDEAMRLYEEQHASRNN